VLLEIQPGRNFQNEIKIPRDHPAGTFWYHPHVHGATAMQVASGMAGALIIRGGIDNLPEIEGMTEQILLFQQIPYDTNGEVEDFDASFGGGVWDDSYRQTTINGQIYPTIHMRPGEIQRWRLIHGGVRETIALNLPGHTLNEIAIDGLVTGRIDAWQTLELQPGYRSDVLVRAAQLPPGQRRAEFILYDGETPAERSLLLVDEDQQPLAKIIVEGPPVVMDMPKEEDLARFVPFEPLGEVEGYQEAVFNIDNGRYTVNGHEFSPHRRRVLELGATEEWTIASETASHPFHIHVNPFEYERIGPDGEPQRQWRDTLMVPADSSVKIRTRYHKYIGTFVLHCHILDHEDQGMMELVEVRLPGSSPDGEHVHHE
jgi:FtsP/CotA-like multicopper oxidase with cupredoxin domain